MRARKRGKPPENAMKNLENKNFFMYSNRIDFIGHIDSLGRMVFQQMGKKANAGRFERGYLKT